MAALIMSVDSIRREWILAIGTLEHRFLHVKTFGGSKGAAHRN